MGGGGSRTDPRDRPPRTSHDQTAVRALDGLAIKGKKWSQRPSFGAHLPWACSAAAGSCVLHWLALPRWAASCCRLSSSLACSSFPVGADIIAPTTTPPSAPGGAARPHSARNAHPAPGEGWGMCACACVCVCGGRQGWAWAGAHHVCTAGREINAPSSQPSWLTVTRTQCPSPLHRTISRRKQSKSGPGPAPTRRQVHLLLQEQAWACSPRSRPAAPTFPRPWVA
jgi:hypothetical protein